MRSSRPSGCTRGRYRLEVALSSALAYDVRIVASDHEIRKVVEAIGARARGRPIAALTGAGISVESGIPDFRSAGGIWTRYDPMEYATIDAFLANPPKVWRFLLELG